MIRLKVLEDEELKRIHERTLDVLENCGVKFSLPEALNIFREAELKVDGDGIVRFPSWVVEDAIKKTPERFTRKPLHPAAKSVELGGEELYFSSGSTPIYVLDASTGKLREASAKDVANYARLVDGLDNFDCANGGFWAKDIPPSIFHAVYFELMVKNTSKPIPAGDALNKKIALDLIRLCSIVLGGEGEIAKKKTFSFAACPNGSRFWGDNVVAFIEGARAGMPLKIMPMPFAGSTHPVTLAGLLVQMNAEILSCVVLAQIVNPGTPVLYAPYPGIMDMQQANHCFGTPETALVAGASAQLARWYGIPGSIVVGTSDSKIPDAQASFEKMMTGLVPALCGASEIGLFGGLLSMAEAISIEQLVIDDEIAGNIKRVHRGIDTGEERLGYDAIKEVLPGGNFLSHEHTLRYFRDELFIPELADRSTRASWEKRGCSSMLERAREKAERILREHEPEGLDRDIEKELEKEIRAICKREGEDYVPFKKS
jgi:trimethylamine--corrinoid protein Co-methyltransferase